MTTPKCPKTGKQSHPTKAEAEGHKAALRRSGASGYRLSVYRCRGRRSCGGWHVGHYRKGRP